MLDITFVISSFGIFGGISDLFVQLMIQLMDFLKSVTGSYGLAIIAFSFIIKLALYYPTQSQYKSMKEMQKLQPEMKKLQEKYKNDQQKLQLETMGLYKKYNINPLGGCLPLLIQMPILIGIFMTIRKMAELGKFTGETFLWIGGPLSKTYSWIGTSLADSDMPLLLIYGVSMFLSQKMTSSGGDPSAEKTQKMMAYAMPIFFVIFLKNLPSSLILYWLVFNILTVVQQYFIMKESDSNLPSSLSDISDSLDEGVKKDNLDDSEEGLPSGRSRSRSRKKKGGKVK